MIRLLILEIKILKLSLSAKALRFMLWLIEK